MREKIGLGAFLDRESVLEDGIAILAEGHRMATRLDVERTGRGSSRDSLRDRGPFGDCDIEVLAWQALDDIDLGIIGRVAWTYCCRGQRQDSGRGNPPP